MTERSPLHAALAAQQKQIEGLVAFAQASQHETIVLKSQLHALGEVSGMSQHFTAIRKQADVNNPAQPWPDPPSEPATQTTEEALAAETMDNVQAPGMTPGSVNHLMADGHDVPYAPGESLPTAPYNELVNVQAPVSGTETQLPLDQTKTQVDVRVGDPMAPDVAFPLNPAFQNQQRTSSRTFASVRLARLQVEAGLATGDDLSLGEHIASSDLSDEQIATQIETLSKVRKAAARQARPGNLVPRAASVQRTTPSLTAEAAVSDDLGDDDALFD